MMGKKNLFFIPLIIISLSSVTIAQDEIQKVVTDRPAQTESAILVPSDFSQIEVGFIYQKEKYAEDLLDIENNNLIFGKTLFRYGFNSVIELRFGGEYLYRQAFTNGEQDIIQGIQNILLGTKINFWRGHKYPTDFSVIIQTIIPFGNKNFRSDRFRPDLRLCVNQNISERFFLDVNAGLRDDDKDGNYFYSYSALLGTAISERLNSFFEIYGKAKKSLVASNNFDCGLKYLYRNNIQVDFSFGTTLSSASTDYFGGFGISVRLPK